MTNNKVVIVVGDVQGEITSAQSRMIERLKEVYGEQIEIITQCDFEKIEGTKIDYMIFDEESGGGMSFINHQHQFENVKPDFRLRNKQFWQKGRWG